MTEIKVVVSDYMIRTGDPMLTEIAEKATSPLFLNKLSKSPNVDTCRAVARNPHTVAVALTGLSKNNNWVVRYWVARHPNTPQRILAHLYRDHYQEVKRGVLKNPNSPIRVVRTLEQTLKSSKIERINDWRKSKYAIPEEERTQIKTEIIHDMLGTFILAGGVLILVVYMVLAYFVSTGIK